MEALPSTSSRPRKVVSIPTGAAKSTNPKIEHVVCLMLENRSFDHMCGYLKSRNSNIDGLTGNESNPFDPSNPKGPSAKVTATSGYVTRVDPDHSVPGTTAQIFGSGSATHLDPAPMNGFVANYAADGDTSDKGAAIMQCFNPNNVPALSSLATQFALFDRWYAAVPGPTQPNRLFMHTATSYGATVNDVEQLSIGYPQTTIYEKLHEAGATWKDYWSDFPSVLVCSDVREPIYWDCIRDIEAFYDDAAAGTLPNYCFVEPRWFELFEVPASDQHPPHPVNLGEYLIADVYEALRNGPKWNSTLLLITYDEHGGFYDHVSPPQRNVPPPDNHRPPAGQAPFNFDRLGIRVPAIAVSPWINANTVIHEPTAPVTGHYTHTSLLATLKKLFNTNSFLTARDAWSPTIDFVVESRTTPRTDCPTKLPRPGTAARGSGGRGHLRMREESPGSAKRRCRVTPGGGDPRDSATESRRRRFRPRHGERVR
eukprot:TRINITY_DN7847_c0_g2_i2.p1 TRINITY_DN7847_c0_g2~~TRINITY_DN7847_c0_g2_i2.p1  ORF type:complete len:483 (-),score=44.04 TRINITY_DN7847_c0_g2_i2:202-1650(-)